MLKKKLVVTTSAWRRSAAASVAVGSMLLLGSCDDVQPKPRCKVRSEDYAARYALQGTPTGMCDGKIITGEILHLGYYRDGKDYAEGLPSVAIEAASVADAAGDLMSHDDTEYGIGKFTSVTTNDQNMCSAPTLKEHTFKKDMVSLGYKWSNFKIIVSATSNAQHFGADLVRTDGDCVATYKVTASSPAVFCGDGMKAVVDEMGKPVLDDMGQPKMEADPTTGKPDESKCANGPDADTGLSPNLVWFCDADAQGMGTHMCLPKYDFPALGKK